MVSNHPAFITSADEWSRPCGPSPPRSRWTLPPTSRSLATGRPPPQQWWSRIQARQDFWGRQKAGGQAQKTPLRERKQSVNSQEWAVWWNGNMCVRNSQSQLCCRSPSVTFVQTLGYKDVCVGVWRLPGEPSYPISSLCYNQPSFKNSNRNCLFIMRYEIIDKVWLWW